MNNFITAKSDEKIMRDMIMIWRSAQASHAKAIILLSWKMWATISNLKREEEMDDQADKDDDQT